MVREGEMVDWGLSLSLALTLPRYLFDFWDGRRKQHQPPEQEPQVRLFFLVLLGEDKTNLLDSNAVTLKACTVSFKDSRGVRHAAEVEAESLYEAAVLGVTRLNHDAWIEKIGPATVLDIVIREP